VTIYLCRLLIDQPRRIF